MNRMVRKRLAGKGFDGAPAGDDGVAMLVVLGMIMVLSLFVLASMTVALNNLKPTRRDQDAKTALAAAQAGVDEYLSRLTTNTNYWKNGSTDSTNPAFTTGQTIQGTGGAGASYTYKLLTTTAQTVSTGQIVLQVTGRSAPAQTGTKVARVLTATLTPQGPLSYVYLSDVEVIDPTIYKVAVPTSNLAAACSNYYYSDINTRKNCANNIVWQTGDVVNGPLHSNDALDIAGTVNFKSANTTTSWVTTQTQKWWGTQNAPLGGNLPFYLGTVKLPVANATLKKYVNPDADGDGAVGPGCYYQGATKIVFTGATMSVLSPGTTNSATPASCYDVTKPTTLQTGLAIPPVIYVDAGSATCTNGQVGYPAGGEYVDSSSGANGVSWGSTTNYTCTRGTAYVQGTAKAQVTIAANDDIVVTGDLKVNSITDTDVIGLMAGNCVWVYHPISRSGSASSGYTYANLYSTTQVSTIQAAILAQRHSFINQNWSYGANLGTLTVTGAIAQEYRGPVGQGTAGYLKSYGYDSRLAYLQPPYFLSNGDYNWQVSSVRDE
jgi:Tfp pilus assembly protein PilX